MLVFPTGTVSLLSWIMVEPHPDLHADSNGWRDTPLLIHLCSHPIRTTLLSFLKVVQGRRTAHPGSLRLSRRKDLLVLKQCYPRLVDCPLGFIKVPFGRHFLLLSPSLARWCQVSHMQPDTPPASVPSINTPNTAAAAAQPARIWCQ